MIYVLRGYTIIFGALTRPVCAMPLYTRRGDAGMTSLLHGVRVSKTSPEFALMGKLEDTRNAIRLAWTYARSAAEAMPYAKSAPWMMHFLDQVDTLLYVCNATIAGKKTSEDELEAIVRDTIEPIIDTLTHWTDERRGGPQRCFVRPGDSELSIALFNATNQCRAAERKLWMLIGEDLDGPRGALGRLLNRLSDMLYAASLYSMEVEYEMHGADDLAEFTIALPPAP